MDSSDTRRRGQAWTRYWATGAAHSCGGDALRGTYAGSIGAFWSEVFSGLQGGERVLDIATGNGPLPRQLLATCPAADVSCDAVDLADVSPDWLRQLDSAQRQRIRVHGGVRAEALPFPDGHFTLVVSQYGLEYADLDAAIPELLRVLAPQGRVRIVAHHRDARPVRLAAHEIAHIDWLLGPDGLLGAAQAMLEPMSRARTAEGRAALARDPRADELRERFNRVQQALSARMVGDACPDVLQEARDWVAQLLHLAAQQGLQAASQAFETLPQWLHDARLRLDELRRHALDPQAVQRLGERLAPRLRLVAVALQERDELLGWALRGDPAP